jgi:tetratricopeptide (TPR) repeat protein
MSHLSEQDFADLWNDRLEPAGLRRIVRHLMPGCKECGARLLRDVPEEVPFWPEERPPEDAYDAAIDHAWRKARKLLPRWNREREQRDDALEQGRARGWDSFTLRESYYRGAWARIEILLQRSFDARYSDPAEMLDFAKTAVEVADRCAPRARVYGDALLLDLRARTWGELANAWRVNERYAQAGSAYKTAHRLLDEGTGDPFLRAHLWDMESSLQLAHGRFAEAVQLLTEAHQAYAKLGESQLTARTLMSKASCLGLSGKPLDAARAHRQAIDQLNAERDPQLLAIAQHNLVNALVDAGKFGEAGNLLLESGLRQKLADDPLNLLRLRWVDAKILAGHGRLTDAERVFGDVRAGFHEKGLLYDEALVGMDLAVVLIKQRKDPGDLAWELYATCGTMQGFQPGAAMALKGFELLCRLQVATVPFAERIRDFLGRLQHFPRLHFDPAKVLVG